MGKVRATSETKDMALLCLGGEECVESQCGGGGSS